MFDHATHSPVSLSRPLHPRMQMRRHAWQSLNGSWQFCYDDNAVFEEPRDITHWPLLIQVPFAPESELSGIADRGFHRICWYQREFNIQREPKRRWLLHLGAVDYMAQVWVNDRLMGTHEGGHTPFSFDITSALRPNGPQRVTIRVEDDPLDLAKPRGKQDWQKNPHSIWYPRTTGIWQTVFLEPVAETRIAKLCWTPSVETWQVGLAVYLNEAHDDATHIRLRLSLGGKVLVEDNYQTVRGEVHRRIDLSDPGVDDIRQEFLWSPESPNLLDAVVELWRDGVCIDSVESYTALRSIGTQQGDFMLNGKPYYLRMVLDQGYWPSSLMTAPTPDALRRDVELVKAMGFNGVRKHQKIEDPEFLYWADVMGLLVWEEMPSAYRFSSRAVERLTREWMEVVARDYNHPCIVVWVPFNESWGVPDLTEKAAHRHYVQTLYFLTKTLDPSRLVVGNDGWENTTTDLIGIHDYDNAPRRLQQRYDSSQSITSILYRRCPAGRLVALEGHDHTKRPLLLTEFGGIACSESRPGGMNGSTSGVWGYSVARTHEEFRRDYTALLSTIHELALFRGFCYTQLTDTFQEANGLLYADRLPKIPIGDIAAATRGTFENQSPESSGTPDEPSLVVPYYINITET